MHVHRYEKIFLGLMVSVQIVMLIAIANAALTYGIRVANPYGRVDPATVAQMAPFKDSTGAVETAPGEVQVALIAQKWTFAPNEIHVPAGAKVTFLVSTPDLIHGFKILETNVNLMVIPGQISRVTTSFDGPGEYLIVCHEYCGIGHQAMFGKVIVDAPAKAASR